MRYLFGSTIQRAGEDFLRALSLFSGVGGLCEGVKNAGWTIAAAVEQDRFAAHNYRLNFPEVPLFEGDVQNLLDPDDKSTWPEQRREYGLSSIDLIFGGPPCQGYSQIGPRDPADPRNELYLHMCRLAEILEPRYILIENVPNMLLMKKGMFRDRILRALRSSGYDNTALSVLNAADFGVPQARKRVFILAAKSDDVSFPLQVVFDQAAESLRKPEVTVDDAISDLPSEVAEDSGISLPYPDCRSPSEYQADMRLGLDGDHYSAQKKEAQLGRCGASHALHNHHTKEIRERRLALIKLLEPGAKADSLPKEVWDNARPEKWRRFDGSKPAHTLLAQMHRDLSEWVHPHLDRWITVREALRLQSFHDGFVLESSEWQQLKQVGNAVPPLLGYVPAMALQYSEALLRDEPAPFHIRGQTDLFSPTSVQ